MPYKIESVTTKDAPSLSPVMMKAFSHDPHWRLLWAPLSQPLPLDSIITSTTARLPRNLITGRMTKRHQKAIDASTGQIVGYARWLLPESAPPSLQWPEAQVAEPSEVEKEEFERMYKNEVTEDGKLKGLNYEVMDKLSPLLEEAEEEILKGGDYLTLDYLTTDPERQKSGIGSLLLASGIREADKAGMKCYVMSTEAGLRLYEKHGFKIVKRIVQSVEEWGGNIPHVHYFLTREAGGRGYLTPPRETEDVPSA